MTRSESEGRRTDAAVRGRHRRDVHRPRRRRRRGPPRFYKRSTTPDEPDRRRCSTCSGPQPPITGSVAASCSAAARVSCSARPARSTRSSPAPPPRRRCSAHRAIQTSCSSAKGGRTDSFDYTQRVPGPVRPAVAHLRGPRADRSPTAPSSCRSTRHAVADVADRLRQLEVEAVAVCLLWSIVNPAHELRVGELLARAPAGASRHALARAQPEPARVPPRISTAIDASLKPLMSRLSAASSRRRSRRPASHGRLLIMTSAGGVLDADDVAAAPIHSIGSGPAMAPVAGRHYALARLRLRHGDRRRRRRHQLRRQPRPPRPHPVDARDAGSASPTYGHMTGFPSVDVRAIGAGGG